MTYSNVNWDSSTKVNCTINNGTITGTGTTTFWSGNVKSTYDIEDGASIKITSHTSTSSNNAMAFFMVPSLLF